VREREGERERERMRVSRRLEIEVPLIFPVSAGRQHGRIFVAVIGGEKM